MIKISILRNRPVRPRRQHIWWYVHAAVIVALVSINFSTATYNPAYHPQNPSWNPALQQQQQQLQEQQQQQHVQWHEPSRGGSTMVAPSPDEIISQPPQEETYRPPKILLKHMSMALRVTSEWNRRLLNGVNHFKFWQRKYNSSRGTSEDHHVPVNVHPSRPWHPPIPVSSNQNDDDELTLFHAKAPRISSGNDDNKSLKGVARWGPELLPYLEHIVDLLGISVEGIEIPLAMIYLDRACSVETPRSNGVPPCPFCTPRTVHRLSLASMLLATQAVKGLSEQDMKDLYEKILSLGIPGSQLEQMVEWMRGALGDTGLAVTIPQMREWGRQWESIFVPQR